MGYAYTIIFIIYWNPYQHFYMKIQEQDNGHRQVEEGHARMMLKSELLLVNSRMVASKYPVWVQSEFETLTEVFDRVGLRTNIHKIVGIVCRSCRAVKV